MIEARKLLNLKILDGEHAATEFVTCWIFVVGPMVNAASRLIHDRVVREHLNFCVSPVYHQYLMVNV